MTITRRSFFKTAGSAAIAVVSAPLFIPSERLDFGVPTQRLVTAAQMPSQEIITQLWYDHFNTPAYGWPSEHGSIPMLLLQDNYLIEFGGRLPAGAEVRVDRTTAERWVSHGVAVPGPSAPADLQARASQREARKAAVEAGWARLAAGARAHGVEA